MKTLISMLLLLLIWAIFSQKESFKTDQLKYSRVREAYRHYESGFIKSLKEQGISPADVHILLMAFKEEQQLELWVKKGGSSSYQKLKTYPVCASSGISGPKRQSGDRQIPEGFYYIDRFNPASNYHLSLGINYPNASDKTISPHPNLGGDIFIHGACVTVGCLPMTDPLISELYVYAVEAKNSGQEKIPVYIFPARMDGPEFLKIAEKHKKEPDLIQFWQNLKEGYERFGLHRQELQYSIRADGRYAFTGQAAVSVHR